VLVLSTAFKETGLPTSPLGLDLVSSKASAT